MLKRIAIVLSILVFASPALAVADTRTDQLTALYTQLVQLLQQELALLKNTSPSLSVAPPFGILPLGVTFTVNNPSGTEAIDFGDGHSTGSNGCTKNRAGWCDLSRPVLHTYQYPGDYIVTMYTHPVDKAIVVSTTSVRAVVASSTSPTGY